LHAALNRTLTRGRSTAFIFDITPKGRNETEIMDRGHDEYEAAGQLASAARTRGVTPAGLLTPCCQ